MTNIYTVPARKRRLDGMPAADQWCLKLGAIPKKRIIFCLFFINLEEIVEIAAKKIGVVILHETWEFDIHE